jgi:hypothetical protein
VRDMPVEPCGVQSGMTKTQPPHGSLSDYFQCVACEQSSHIVHDPMHIFLKLRRPAPATVTSEQSLVPSLYVATSTGMLTHT